MRGLRLTLSLAGGLSTFLLVGAAQAGAVSEQFRNGAFGLSWKSGRAAIEAKYPGGTWDKDEDGVDRYCAPSRQTLLGLPPQHQTRQLCFRIGSDQTLAAATAHLDASLPSLLAIVNRSRTRFGDFDAVKRDEGSVQSRFTYMMWTKDAPIVVVVGSTNNADGHPETVAFTVTDDASMFIEGAAKVSNRPTGT